MGKPLQSKRKTDKITHCVLVQYANFINIENVCVGA